jgi:hypothetical protein
MQNLCNCKNSRVQSEAAGCRLIILRLQDDRRSLLELCCAQNNYTLHPLFTGDQLDDQLHES